MNISIRHTKIKEPAKKAYIRTVRNDCGEIVSSSLYLWLLDDEKKAIFDMSTKELQSDSEISVDIKTAGHWGVIRTTIIKNVMI